MEFDQLDKQLLNDCLKKLSEYEFLSWNNTNVS
jgi:hypothetical protein